jgi:ubiquinone/menaquinone biosynthesis C-methylase UbiE/predicted Fe-Mo cluster-binding NifX family protein
MSKYYPRSKLEINGLMARYYDATLNIATFGKYSPFIKRSIELMDIKPEDRILDLGAGTGRNTCLMVKYLSEKGELIGIDISREMIRQFRKKCINYPNAKIICARVDKSLPFREEFDKVFISFVLHGFPQDVREVIIKNAFEALKSNGNFFVLDYNEFSYKEMPFYLKIPFKHIECPYAFDFIERDWKQILESNNFSGFEEFYFFRDYVRLLKAKKSDIAKENSIRVAIPTNDGISIFPRMLGMAKEIFIYEIENGKQFRLIEKRTNPYESTMQHLKTLDVYEIIRDCGIIISAKIGKKGIKRLRERGMKLFFTKGNMQEALINVIRKEEPDGL